ncbi:MAG: ABC transporter ATP-binding protein [Brevinematia bacterium]
MLEVINISKSFGNLTAVKNLSFLVEKQSIFGIVGPDGAGKSTLLRILAGVLKPSEGEVKLGGIDVFSTPDVKYRISYMPQSFGLYEDLTVEENLHFIGRLFGVPAKERERRIERLYEFSNLKPFKNRLAGRLSGGMKQKLGLMCALMHNPELLILDEPTNGVDPVSRREFWDILYELLKGGTTIVLSTAYLDEAERCSKVALMYNGSFIFSGEIEEIKRLAKEKFIEIHTEDSIKFARHLKEKFNIDIFVRGNSILFFTDSEKIISLLEKEKMDWSIKEPSLEDVFVKCIKETH